MNDQPWVYCIKSHNVSGNDERFATEIRARDGRCVISGVVNRAAYRRQWAGSEAAHIFPLEMEDPVWIQENFGRWITDMDDTNGSKINSIQDGMCFSQKFISYLIPDIDESQITVTRSPRLMDNLGLDGRVLHPVC